MISKAKLYPLAKKVNDCPSNLPDGAPLTHFFRLLVVN